MESPETPDPTPQEMMNAQEAANAESEEVRARAAEVAELRDQVLRANADLQNLRRRTEREAEDRARRKAESLLRAILGGIDELDRALGQIAADRRENDPLAQGVAMIREILIQAAAQEGVREIPTVGLPFDPKLHEALSSVPTAGVPVGHIASEHRKGYLWGDRVLRPSQVIVSGGPAGDPSP